MEHFMTWVLFQFICFNWRRTHLKTKLNNWSMLGTVLHVLMKMIYEEDENDFVKNFWLITDKWNLIGTMIVLAWYVVRTSLSKVRWDKMIIRWHSGHFLVVLWTQFYMKWHCLSELNSTEDLKNSKRLFFVHPWL